MARIKNTSGQDLLVPWLGGRLVVAGAVVEVPSEDVAAYTQQTATWEPADKATQKIHDAALKPAVEAPPTDPGTEPDTTTTETLEG